MPASFKKQPKYLIFDRLRTITFFLIIFFISSQVGIHFWPKFSYVTGVRVDYLSPTLYLLDILVVLFVIAEVRGFGAVRAIWGRMENSRFVKISLFFFFLSLLWNIFASKSPGAHVFGLVKLLEFTLFGISVAFFFKRKHIRYFVEVICLSAIVSSILAIWQFINQGSAGGIWYLFGERSFNTSTIGVSTVNLSHQILRAYGAFPHPNVLAFFLLITIIFSFLRIGYEKEKKERIFLIFSALIASLALMLTFSRTSIFIAIALLLYAIYTKGKSNYRVILVGLGLLGILGLLVGKGFLLRGIDFRWELLEESWKIFLMNPYFGIGLNNFFINQAPLIKTISPIIFQPVHNVFILALMELGILGFWILPIGAVGVVRAVWRKMRTQGSEVRAFYKSVFIALISIITVGMFDHFFLTLEQGQIILALIIGLSFAKLK